MSEDDVLHDRESEANGVPLSPEGTGRMLLGRPSRVSIVPVLATAEEPDAMGIQPYRDMGASSADQFK